MKTIALARSFTFAVLALTILGLVAGCQQTGTQKTGEGAESATAATAADPVARGRYLVTLGSCNDCHTPWHMGPKGPEPDMSRMLQGHPSSLVMPPPPKLPEGPWGAIGSATFTAWAGPWGVSYAANLTPDQNTGLGSWNEDMFIKAMRTGKHMGAERPILPPMPWPSVAQMTDEDIKAVFAYLRSIPAIANAVPDPVIAPPPAAMP